MGKVYDVQSLFNRLNRIYFDQKLSVNVRWSRRAVKRASTRILLGSYCDKKKEIVLSQRLDNLDVPLFFVEHVLFHEMLHAVFPREKHQMHTDTFKAYEKLHPDFGRALEWEKQNKEILFKKPQQKLPFAVGI